MAPRALLFCTAAAMALLLGQAAKALTPHQRLFLGKVQSAAPAPPLTNLRITSTGDFRVTNTGDNRAVFP